MSQPASLTPQETREVLERSYADGYKRSGIPISDAAVKSQVVADLQLVEAARREGELVEISSAEPIAVDREKPQEIVDAERETRTRVLAEHEHGERLEFRSNDYDPRQTSEKFAYACGRIQRICEGVSMSSDFRTAAKTCAMPQLALEVLELQWNFIRRHMPALVGKHNPFIGMSDVDAERMLESKIYDICDRSTGKLGFWYVK